MLWWLNSLAIKVTDFRFFWQNSVELKYIDYFLIFRKIMKRTHGRSVLLSLLCLFSLVVTLKRTWVIYQWLRLNSSSVDCAVRTAAVSDHQQWLTWPWCKRIPHSLFFPSLHVSKVHLCKCSSENICCASVCMRLQILVILHSPLTNHDTHILSFSLSSLSSAFKK